MGFIPLPGVNEFAVLATKIMLRCSEQNAVFPLFLLMSCTTFFSLSATDVLSFAFHISPSSKGTRYSVLT